MRHGVDGRVDAFEGRSIVRRMPDAPMSNQQRILVAAKKLFLAKGFNGSNLRDIAREAKVSMGGIYHHFASKEDIYKTLLAEGDVATDMQELLQLFQAPDFPDNLGEVGKAIARVVAKHRDAFKLFYIDVLEFEGRHTKPVIQAFRDGFRAISGSLLVHRKDQLADFHPALMMRLMVDVFLYSHLEEAMLEQPMAEALGMDEEELTRQMAQMLLYGIIKR